MDMVKSKVADIRNLGMGRAAGTITAAAFLANSVGNLPWVRGTSRPGVKKAPRGAQHKEAIKQEKRWKELDTKVEGKIVQGPKKGKYPGIDKAMENIKKSGNIFGKAKGGKVK